MERAAWTDERLDDLAEAMRSGFQRLDQDLRDLRSEVRQEIGGLRGEIGGLRGEIGGLRGEMREEIGGLRGEMREEIGALRGEIATLKTTIIRLSGAGMVGLIGVIAAVLTSA